MFLKLEPEQERTCLITAKAKVTGIDISKGMLDKAIKKITS